MDTNTKIVIACDESACAMFESGHEEFWSPIETSVIHERPAIAGPGYILTIERLGSEPLWSVEIQVSDSDPTYTPDQAVSFATDLLRASTECRTLNA